MLPPSWRSNQFSSLVNSKPLSPSFCGFLPDVSVSLWGHRLERDAWLRESYDLGALVVGVAEAAFPAAVVVAGVLVMSVIVGKLENGGM